MNKTNDFKYNLPAYSDPVDIEDLNDNFRGIDDALMAGLCKKDYTGNNMGSSDPSARKYAWAPWLEIVNDNEFDVVVADRNAPVESEEATINIAAGQTFRKYINGRYYMNFYVQDQHDVTFKWFTNAETYINESGGGGGGTGTVTSVSVQGGSGSHLTGSGNPIETSGTITINVDDGYSIPSDNEQTAWDGKAADLKAEIDSSTYVLTLQLKDSAGNLIGTAKTIDLPLETMVVDGEYDSQTKKIKLELKNGNYVEFSVADLVSGLQTELSASNKLDPAYIDYDSSHRAVSDTEKDTWSGKQNAISDLETIRSGATAGATAVQPSAMQTALAGKQDSLDQTQLAAVNSGIDSTKVAQISTNQSNILYGLNRNAKNLIDFKFNDTPTTGQGYYWDTSCDLPAGTYSISFLLTSTQQVGMAVTVDGSETTKYLQTGTKVSHEYTFTATTGITRVRFWINSGTNTIYDFMISLKDVYDADPSYQLYGAPNYDLTYLEAQDRAALAEEIDAGAKNKFIPKAGTQAGITAVVNSDNSLNVTWTAIGSSNAYCRINDNNLKLPVGTYVLSGLTESGTLNYYLHLEDSAGNIVGNVAYNTPNRYLEFTVTDATRYYKMYIGVEANASAQSTAKTVYPMICTKAAFGVSNKFVPYRPNYDLVGSMASALNSPTLTVPTKHSNITSVKSGGYFRIGNIVIVNIVCTVDTALPLYQVLFTDLPTPVANSSLAAGDGVAVLSTNKDCILSLTKAGQIINYESAIDTGSLEISGVYICS